MRLASAPIPTGALGRGHRWSRYTQALLATKGEVAVVMSDVPVAERYLLLNALRTHPDIQPGWFVRNNGRHSESFLVWLVKR